MLLHKLWRRWIGRIFRQSRRQHTVPRRTRPRLTFQHLEDRTVPTTLSVNAGDATTLISDIGQANSTSSASNPYIIDLANSTYAFSSTNNTTDGANVLPVITAVNLTIVGNGSTLNASSQGRLFDVASAGTLTLQNLTLTGGLAKGSGTAAEGGAIYNSGALTLNSAVVTGNVAEGNNGENGATNSNNRIGANASGGGLYVVGGTVALGEDTFSNNKVLGGDGYSGSGLGNAGNAGSATGGGLYLAVGTVTLSKDTIKNNKAVGGSGGSGVNISSGHNGGNGGSALGGGMYVASDEVTRTSGTLSSNEAIGGNGGQAGNGTGTPGGGGSGVGGGLYVTAGGVVLQNGTDGISGNSVTAGDNGGAASFSNVAANSSGLGTYGFSSETVLTSSANPSVYGQSLTFTATVTANGLGPPSGSVTFYDGGTSLGSGTLNTSGVATLTTSALPVGSDSITAAYSGDDTFMSTVSAALSQQVNSASTSVSLTSSANPSTSPRVTFTATVSATAPGTGTPTGSVTFYDGSSSLGSGVLNTSGVVTLGTTLPAGTRHISAVYSGDGNFKTSDSAVLSQVINLVFLPSPTNSSQLRDDLAIADGSPGTYSITLSNLNSYVLDDTTGSLPEIAPGVSLTINGDGATIARSSTSSVFRLFDVAASGSLTLQNLTLTGGLALGNGTAAEGGAIYSDGRLNLIDVTVQGNEALGSPGANGTANGSPGTNAFGGGLYVAGGTVTMSGDVISGNTAVGGRGGNAGTGSLGGTGGEGYGGGLEVAGGTLASSDDTFTGNTVIGGAGGSGGGGSTGGQGGAGGAGHGGGVEVTGGAVVLSKDMFTSNQALGGNGGNNGYGDASLNVPPNGGTGGAAYGGGLEANSSITSLILTNNTLSGNSADGGIGGQAAPGRGVYHVGQGGNRRRRLWGRCECAGRPHHDDERSRHQQ